MLHTIGLVIMYFMFKAFVASIATEAATKEQNRRDGY